MAQQTPQKQLFDILVTKNFDPELLDATGRPSQNPAEADIFSFDYVAESGNDYGTVVIMFADENDVQIYFGDNLGKGMEQEDKNDWFSFLHQIKNFATKNLMTFSTKDLNRLKYSMQGQAAIKEGLFESWTGTRTTSWNGRPTEARLMIKHKRPLGETDARFRYVESLFIETAEGERYKLPFTKLSGGRAMVEHVRQGGRVWDARGQHITEMVNELNVLSRFRRANHNKIFEGDTKDLVEQTNAYYESAQKTLKSMSHSRGYHAYFESWKPLEITEEEIMIEGLKHLFVTQSLDSRIEDALPLLAKIQQQGNAMKEANIFEAWVNNLAEGTWAVPDSKEKQAKLVALMSKELPVGPDATNATEQLYDLLGDDELFDQLEALADKDPDADARQVIYDRMQMLSHDPDIQKVINSIQISDQATMNPSEPTDAGMSANPDDAQIPELEEVKDPYTQTEDPAGTKQPVYSAYQDDLAAILKAAGVDDTVVAAPNYEAEIDEDVPTIGGSLGTMGGMTTDKPDAPAPMPNINDIVKSKLDTPAPTATPVSAPATPQQAQIAAVDKAQGGDNKRIDLAPVPPGETSQQALTRQIGNVDKAYKASDAGKADVSANPPGAKPALTPGAAPAATTTPTAPAATTAPAAAPKANVSAAELDAWRKEVGNPNATLGQYLNAKQGLTARKGGANDPDVIQAKLGAGQQAYRPGASTAPTATANTTTPATPAVAAKPETSGMTTDKPDTAKTTEPAAGEPGSQQAGPVAPPKPEAPKPASKADVDKAYQDWQDSKPSWFMPTPKAQATSAAEKEKAYKDTLKRYQSVQGTQSEPTGLTTSTATAGGKNKPSEFTESLATILKHAGIKK